MRSCVLFSVRCKLCPLTFLTKSEMQFHSKSHTEAKPHKCPHCSKTFANASYLSQHLRIHLGIKPYHCSYCENSFRQLSHLQQHTRSVQLSTQSKGSQASVCVCVCVCVCVGWGATANLLCWTWKAEIWRSHFEMCCFFLQRIRLLTSLYTSEISFWELTYLYLLARFSFCILD